MTINNALAALTPPELTRKECDRLRDNGPKETKLLNQYFSGIESHRVNRCCCDMLIRCRKIATWMSLIGSPDYSLATLQSALEMLTTSGCLCEEQDPHRFKTTAKGEAWMLILKGAT